MYVLFFLPLLAFLQNNYKYIPVSIVFRSCFGFILFFLPLRNTPAAFLNADPKHVVLPEAGVQHGGVHVLGLVQQQHLQSPRSYSSKTCNFCKPACFSRQTKIWYRHQTRKLSNGNLEQKISIKTSWDQQCCGSGSGQIRTFFSDPVPDPDPTIKSHITRSKSNKLKRYFCEQFTFFK